MCCCSSAASRRSRDDDERGSSCAERAVARSVGRRHQARQDRQVHRGAHHLGHPARDADRRNHQGVAHPGHPVAESNHPDADHPKDAAHRGHQVHRDERCSHHQDADHFRWRGRQQTDAAPAASHLAGAESLYPMQTWGALQSAAAESVDPTQKSDGPVPVRDARAARRVPLVPHYVAQVLSGRVVRDAQARPLGARS